MTNMTIAHVMTFRNTDHLPGTVARGLLRRVRNSFFYVGVFSIAQRIFADQYPATLGHHTTSARHS